MKNARARPTPSLHAGFTFDDAAAAAKHLADLGVTHAYCSPYPHAAEGSSQRYDVIDHSTLNRELGGEEGSSMGSATARQHGRGCAAQGPEALHGHWRRLQEHVTMLSEAEGAPIGRALTPEEQKAAARDRRQQSRVGARLLCGGPRGKHFDARRRGEAHPRKDVDLEKMWDVESRKGLPLRLAQQERDELGYTNPEHYLWCASQHHHYDPTKPGKKWDGAWRSYAMRPACPASGSTTCGRRS